jgi:hypothetical protein
MTAKLGWSVSRNKVVALLAFTLLALATSISSYNVWSVLTSNILPPGDLAPLAWMGLKAFERSSSQAVSYGLTALLPAALSHLGLAELDALGIAVAAMFTLIPLTVAYLSWIITRSYIASAVAGLLAAFFPALAQPIFVGDYPLLGAIALASLSLTLSLRLSSSPSSKLFAGAILAGGLAIFADASAFVAMICPLALWSIISWKDRDPIAFRCLLTTTVFTIGLWLFLLPFDVGGYAARARNGLLWPSILSPQTFLPLLAVVTVASLASLWLASRKTAIRLVGWLAPLIVLACRGDVQYLLFALPALIAVCSHLLLRTSGLLRVLTHGEEMVFEIHLTRLVAVVLFMLLVATAIFYYPSSIQACARGNVLSEEEVAVVKELCGRLRELITDENRLLAAPPRISAWLGAFGGLNTVVPITDRERWELDALTSTAFRLMNSYMMVDEWQPFSSTRSPFIYSYDGSTYAFILHVDDGTNTINLVESNITWHEDMHGLKLMNYSWLETPDEVMLITNFWKRGFNVTKTISLAKNEARLSISYYIVPNKGVKLINMTLPVYIEGRQRISSSSGNDWIQLDMPHVKVRLTYEGASTKPVLVYSSVQDYVVASFTARDGVIRASLKITLLNPRHSSEPVRYTSFFDLIKKWPVSYLLSYAAPEGLLFLQDELERPVEVLEVIDSFNRVILNHEGVNYVEAPAYAKVLNESIDGQNRVVKYQTAGLVILKEVNVTHNAVGIRYEVEPFKPRTQLISMTLSLWVPWTRTVFSQEASHNKLKLTMDVGNYTIKVVRGNVTFLGLGPDPEFKQLKVQIQVSLKPMGDVVELKIEAEGAIRVEYNACSRPVMDGSDILKILCLKGIFSPIYQDKMFALYKITPP